MPATKQTLLPVAAACEALHVSRRTLNRLFDSGAIPRVKVGTRTFIAESAIDRYKQRIVVDAARSATRRATAIRAAKPRARAKKKT